MSNYKYQKLLIIDGAFLMHRTLSIDRLYEMKNTKGVSTGGIDGCLKSIESFLKLPELKGYYPVCTWDRGINERRKNLYPEYKNKKAVMKTPEDERARDEYIAMYREQRNRLIEILDTLGIPNFLIDNQEGDDTGKILIDMTENCICITSDKDWLQNLKTDHVRVYNPIKKIMYTEENLKTHFGVESVSQFLTEKILLGDPSDNIPSCIKGVGEKGVHEYYKYFMSYNNNFDNYIRDEKECKKYCEERNIKYKKAYINLDIERYKINEQLINLKYVNEEKNIKEIINSINSSITLSQQKRSFMQTIKALNKYNITNIDTDTITRELNMRRNFLYSNLPW